MAGSSCIVYPGNGRWVLGWRGADGHSLDVIEAGEGRSAVDRVVERLLPLCAGRGVLLALPSEMCLPVVLSIDELPSRGDRQALAYALEQQLPLSAKGIEAAVVCGTAAALAVVVESARVREWIDELESRGVMVQSIAPLAVLAVQGIMGKERIEGRRLVLWQHDEHVECLTLDGDSLASWQTLPAGVSFVQRQLHVAALRHGQPMHVIGCNLSEPLRHFLSSTPVIVVRSTTPTISRLPRRPQGMKCSKGNSRPGLS